MTDPVDVRLSGDEALVLFDWLTRHSQADDLAFDDQAEQRVLWDLEAMLESKLSAPLLQDYPRLLAAARARVRDRPEVS